jgi:Protein of unknown function (DUF2695)
VVFGVAAVREAEAIVLDLHRKLTTPRSGECLYCYVQRMLADHGCNDRLRWATRYRDLTAPRAKALEQRLGRMGGFCDCELFINGVTLARGVQLEAPRPACAGVRASSTQGCTNWERRRR